jgi:hypothetical protein
VHLKDWEDQESHFTLVQDMCPLFTKIKMMMIQMATVGVKNGMQTVKQMTMGLYWQSMVITLLQSPTVCGKL